MSLVNLKIRGATDEQISINPINVQELLIISKGTQHYVQLVVVSGRSYILVDDSNKSVFDTLTEAKILRDQIMDTLELDENTTKADIEDLYLQLGDIESVLDIILGE